MTTYNSYEEAKIANPDSEIVTTGPDWRGKRSTTGKFQVLNKQVLERDCWVICDPSNHCMTVERFLANGHKFVIGDICINMHHGVEEVLKPSSWNEPSKTDNERYILRAAALGKQKRVKVEYVKVEYPTTWQAAKDHEERVEFLYRQSDLGEAIKGNKWKAIQSPSEAAQYHFDVYRRIETEITERDEFIDKAMEIAERSCNEDARAFLGLVFDELVKGE